MGTSSSSKGPGGGVPMVPPWVPSSPPAAPPAPESPNQDDGSSGEGGDEKAAPSSLQVKGAPAGQPPLRQAPPRRFVNARRSLGSFAHSGDSVEMRRGVGHYIRGGYGGGSQAVRRFGGTASTAGAIYGALTSVSQGQPAAPGSPLDPALLAGRSAREVIDAVVEAVRPADGTQDAEAERASTKDALSELLTLFPEADLLNLDEAQRDLATELFVAIDVFRRLQLDLGRALQDKAPSASAGLARLKELKDYVKETVAAAFRKLRAAGTTLTKGSVSQIVNAALLDAFEVFESYAT
jgi:hypothetical protein